MKRSICVFTMFMIGLCLSAQWTVRQDGNGDFLTIQAAINDNNVQSGDDITVYYFFGDTPYGPINLGSKRLTIQAYPSHTPVISSSSGYVVNMGTEDYSELDGFEITTTSNSSGIFIESQNLISISNCDFISLNIGIYITDNSSPCNNYSTITNCYFYDNTTACYLNDNPSYYSYTLKPTFSSCEFEDNATAFYINGCYYLHNIGCLFFNNTTVYDMSNDRSCLCYLDRITVSENSCGFDFEQYATFNIESSIIYDNTTNMTGTPSGLNITYSCIEGGYTGTGNTGDDPNFCFEYPYEYLLMEGSPCIDTGNPSYNDIDGTIRDMGFYPSLTDIKECEGDHYNYVSFPRMNRTGNNTRDVTTILDNFLDWPFSDLSLDHISEDVLVWDGEDWTPTSYPVTSTQGFKLFTSENDEHYLPSEYNGSRLSSSQTIDLTDEEANWIGYWLPYTQNIEDAFGDFWEYIYSVEAEDWYYEWAEEETPTSSPTNKNMVYGKGYIVRVNEYVEDFYWPYFSISEESEMEESQYFSFNYLANYEAIDVMDIPENVIEIGVFENETCVGAVVVDEEDEQILAYTTGQSPISFEVVTGSRQTNQPVSNYSVYNSKTGLYENRSVISGRQKHSVVSFGSFEDYNNLTPPTQSVVLHNNQPNPFNPSTTISFSLPSDQEIELCIYNMKGQLVRQMISGQFTSGEHSITWDGTDQEGKNVSSGLYLYKLKTSNHEYSKKMILLK